MEQFHIHQLFQEISNKLICPACEEKISPLALELKSSEGNTCNFEAACSKCGNIASVSAIVETQVTTEGQKMNASSRIQAGGNHTPIQEAEIKFAHDNMKTHNSFTDLFNA